MHMDGSSSQDSSASASPCFMYPCRSPLRDCRFEDCIVRLSDWTMAKVYGTALRG